MVDQGRQGGERLPLTVEEIEQIVELVRHAAWGYLELRRGDLRVTWQQPPAPTSAPPPAVPSALVPAPVVGRFYRGRRPAEPPLVEPGQWVTEGSQIGTVERLDEPHPVYAGRAGRLETFLVADGSFVEYGQAVAVLRPAADA